MRRVTLEKYISFPDLVGQIPKEVLDGLSFGDKMGPWVMTPKLADIGAERLKSMDDNGISTQVISVSGAGADLIDPEDATAFARQYNDALSQRMTPNP